MPIPRARRSGGRRRTPDTTGGGRRRTPGTTVGRPTPHPGHDGREADAAPRARRSEDDAAPRARRSGGRRRTPGTTGGDRRRTPDTTGGDRRRTPGTTVGRPTPHPGHDGRETDAAPRAQRSTTRHHERSGTTGGGRRPNAGHAGCREARGASRGNTGRCPVRHRGFPQLALRASRQRQQRTGHPCQFPGHDGREAAATPFFCVSTGDFCRCDRGGPASSCGFLEAEISWRTTAPHTATHPKAP
jgi:hypothetical protein